MSENAGDTGVRTEPEAETQTSLPEASASSADQLAGSAADGDEGDPHPPEAAGEQHLPEHPPEERRPGDGEEAVAAGGQGDDQPPNVIDEGSQTETEVRTTVRVLSVGAV